MNRIGNAAVPNGIEKILGHGEEIRAVAVPKYATVGPGPNWPSTTLVLTSQRLIVTKDRLLGKPKPDFSAEWSGVGDVHGQLWNGGGPDIQLVVPTTQGDLELIVTPILAVEVESAIRDGYIGLR